jgi:hypothetical protein
MNIIGDLNPQLLRELKGRFKNLPIILTIVISIIIQVILFFSQLQSYPDQYYAIQSPYCNLSTVYSENMRSINSEESQIHQKLQSEFNYYSRKENYDLSKIKTLKKQISDNSNKYQKKRDKLNITPYCPPNEINSQLWWQDNMGKIFKAISELLIYSLLVGGVYFLIHDLSKENRQGSLNFIRLTPQSAKSILLGKGLGVPILLYIAIFLAIPLQFFTGLASKVPFTSILGFDVILIFCSMVFYSVALLFTLVTPRLSAFQSWLGAGLVFTYLSWSKNINFNGTPTHTPPNFISLFNPYFFIPGVNVDYVWEKVQWFGINFEKRGASLAIFTTCFYVITSCFIWQSLERRFNNIEANILSKKQSYILTFCFTIILFGSIDLRLFLPSTPLKYHDFYEILKSLITGYIFLSMYLILALTPGRQKLQDWSRYRRFESHKKWLDKKLIKDLIFNDKSPSTVAMFINTMIYLVFCSGFILAFNVTNTAKLYGLTSQAIATSLMILYAAIFQLSLFSKSQHRILWGIGNLAAVILIPIIFMGMLYNLIFVNSESGLFAITAPFTVLDNYKFIPHQSYLVIFTFYWTMIIGLSFILFKGLKKAGET